MVEQGLDGFVIPKADEYQGEFTAPYAERLAWLTGFTGSAGVAVVLADKACVFSDGRYHLQLDQQVDGDVFETGDSVGFGAGKWLDEHAQAGSVIGYDPWLHTSEQIKSLEKDAADSGLIFKSVEENPLDQAWADQPEKSCEKANVFPEDISCMTLNKKKKEVALKVKNEGAKACIISLPDSICWLLNVRGSDIDYIPSVLSYAIVYADETQPVQWIVDPQKVSELDLGADVEIVGLDALKSLEGPVMLDCTRSPAWFKATLEAQGVEVLNAKDPCIDLKAIKTPQEIAAIKRAHIVDGVAVTRLLYWLSHEGEGRSELEAAAKIQEFRENHPAFKGPSFPTISGFGSNGAIVHYRSNEETNKTLEAGNLLLVDSGGQYAEGDVYGTTDITRTVAIGEASNEMRRNFTLTLKGHIALARAQFSEGTTGMEIDELARAPLQAEGLDYAHGTGHGVGCYLAVHEEAASISPRGKEAFKSGMLISNEPGYYKEGAYGIRIENLVFVEARGEGMLGFETVSYAPLDRALIDVELLDQKGREWLNAYHSKTYELLSPHLKSHEAQWLKEQTAPF